MSKPRAVDGVRMARAIAAGGKQAQRISFRGWIVDVVDDVVVIPSQRCTRGMAVADLETLIAHAKAEAQKKLRPPMPCGAEPKAEQPGARHRRARAYAEVLRSAHHMVADQWHPLKCDVYQCIGEAWESHSNPDVAHTALVKMVRDALPDPTIALMDFNDSCNRRDIVELFDRALSRALAEVQELAHINEAGPALAETHGAA